MLHTLHGAVWTSSDYYYHADAFLRESGLGYIQINKQTILREAELESYSENKEMRVMEFDGRTTVGNRYVGKNT